jgi:hypothetical protein
MNAPLNVLEQFNLTWSFSIKEWETFERLKREFERDRHLENRFKPRSPSEEIEYAILHIRELIRKEIDIPTRTFLFRIQIFFEAKNRLAGKAGELSLPTKEGFIELTYIEKIILRVVGILAIIWLLSTLF